MSDGTFDPGGWLPLESRSASGGGGGGFRSDMRYTQLGAAPPVEPVFEEPSFPQIEEEDPVAVAFAEGYAAGATEAQAHAAQQAAADAAAREGLAIQFAKLDEVLAEQLRQRLRDTVAALCESAIAPLALDEDALIYRIERAVALFSRADDERVIRLHPKDIALLSPRFAEDWQVVPDASLERGGLRVESVGGGAEDGPELWRRAIAEALHQC